jgi:hypothetical protein
MWQLEHLMPNMRQQLQIMGDMWQQKYRLIMSVQWPVSQPQTDANDGIENEGVNVDINDEESNDHNDDNDE